MKMRRRRIHCGYAVEFPDGMFYCVGPMFSHHRKAGVR